MSNQYGPRIVTNGLVLCLDAGNVKSYPGSGISWNDLSGNNQNFILYNNPIYSNNQMIFSGSTDYARLRNSTVLGSCATNGSIELWVRSLSSSFGSAYARIISISDSNSAGADSAGSSGINNDYLSYFCIAQNNLVQNVALWYKNSPGGFGLSNSILLNTQTFYHIVYTWTTIGANMVFNMYLNGTKLNSATFVQTPFANAASVFTIGANSQSSLSTTVENSSIGISVVRLYNKNLSDNDIINNYNASKSRYLL